MGYEAEKYFHVWLITPLSYLHLVTDADSRKDLLEILLYKTIQWNSVITISVITGTRLVIGNFTFTNEIFVVVV